MQLICLALSKPPGPRRRPVRLPTAAFDPLPLPESLEPVLERQVSSPTTARATKDNGTSRRKTSSRPFHLN